MVAAVRVHKVGGPEVLTYEEIDVPAPGQGQLRVKQYACGVNFIDVYFRMGMYPSPVGLPFVSGNEGAGEVTAVGPGVTDFKVGDHVGYVTALGCYAAERLVAADRAVKVPDGIGHEQVAGMMLKGMTVEYLVRRTFKVEKGMNVFVHAAAGGVGLILCQWANHLGANVIGTVGSKDKAELAKKYAEERAKRLRPDGNDQYVRLQGQLAHYLDEQQQLAVAPTVTAKWMPGWKAGFDRVQGADLLGLGLDRIAADLAAAEFVSLAGENARPLFDGTASSVTFVRSAIGPNASAGLEIVRLAETDDARGRVLVRDREVRIEALCDVRTDFL